jgi:hypothetical protein
MATSKLDPSPLLSGGEHKGGVLSFDKSQIAEFLDFIRNGLAELESLRAENQRLHAIIAHVRDLAAEFPAAASPQVAAPLESSIDHRQSTIDHRQSTTDSPAGGVGIPARQSSGVGIPARQSPFKSHHLNVAAAELLRILKDEGAIESVTARQRLGLTQDAANSIRARHGIISTRLKCGYGKVMVWHLPDQKIVDEDFAGLAAGRTAATVVRRRQSKSASTSPSAQSAKSAVKQIPKSRNFRIPKARQSAKSAQSAVNSPVKKIPLSLVDARIEAAREAENNRVQNPEQHHD